ncbi:MAG: hypothetical protein R3A46_09090 [Thermomicrobiales bacterium]
MADQIGPGREGKPAAQKQQHPRFVTTSNCRRFTESATAPPGEGDGHQRDRSASRPRTPSKATLIAIFEDSARQRDRVTGKP